MYETMSPVHDAGTRRCTGFITRPLTGGWPSRWTESAVATADAICSNLSRLSMQRKPRLPLVAREPQTGHPQLRQHRLMDGGKSLFRLLVDVFGGVVADDVTIELSEDVGTAAAPPQR